RTNDRIRVPEVRLVGPNGEQVGVVRIEDAIRLAQEADLDLVEVAPNSKPPVAKIMDFGKFKYETAQKAKEARRNQANTILKEVRFRLKIDVHDYETKRKRAEGFLKAGDKVKAMILFRGREQSRQEQGVRLLQRFAEDVAEVGSVESTPMIDGRNMVMVIGPLKNKAEAKAEADAKRAASKPQRSERGHETDDVVTAPVTNAAPAESVEAPAAPAPVVVSAPIPPAAEAPAKAEPVEVEPAKAEPVKAEPVVEVVPEEKATPAPKAAPAPSATPTPKAATPAPKAPAPKAPAPKAPAASATPKAPVPKPRAVAPASKDVTTD
ncbi:MAG: translation initiation factor, partial [Microbacteriaceae bacterium]|nr:translation initiation factor [Microbacteriaceae bacterium]